MYNRRTWVTAAIRNFAFKIAAKPLQIKAWLLFTAYMNSSSLHPTVLSPTPYDARFSHNTRVTDSAYTYRH